MGLDAAMLALTSAPALASVLALAALATSPGPDAPPPIDDPEANVVEALIVDAKLPGPAWWRISDGDTTIYVLGVLQALPKGQGWDSGVLDRRLDGAFALLLPPEAKAGIGDLPAALALRGKLKSTTPLGAAVGDLGPKLARARATLGKGVEAYDGWNPLGAGIMMAGDYRKGAKLDPGEPERTIGRLARKHRVKARPVATYKADAAGQDGGARALARGRPDLPGRRAGRGQRRTRGRPRRGPRLGAGRRARGDRRPPQLPALPAGPAGDGRPGTQGDARRGRGVERGDADAGACRGGYGIRSLVARGGVLDQMRARGFEVSTPGE
jgi:hypothetical protein